eukprot:GSChrysophyteH2.ASY1.ANO1.1703.1 assembled CDS
MLASDELCAALTFAAAMGSGSSSAAPAKKAAKTAAADDDDFDMFGDEEEEEEEEEWDGTLNADGESAAEVKAAAARRERMDAALKLKQAADAKKEKKVAKEKPPEKSLIVLEVKPWEAETDLKMVWEEICKSKQDGLTWGASYKLEEMAFGIKKLVMTCSIEDAKVLMDDVTDKIEALDQWVQSVQVASMNKI